MEFHMIHLMPFADLDLDYDKKHNSAWVTLPNTYYDPAKGAKLYNRYIDELVYADEQVRTCAVQRPDRVGRRRGTERDLGARQTGREEGAPERHGAVDGWELHDGHDAQVAEAIEHSHRELMQSHHRSTDRRRRSARTR